MAVLEDAGLKSTCADAVSACAPGEPEHGSGLTRQKTPLISGICFLSERTRSVYFREQDAVQLRVGTSLENQGKIGQIPAMGAKSFSDRRLKLRDPVTRA